MRTYPTICLLLVLFTVLGGQLLAAEVSFGSHEKLIKLYNLPDSDRYISSDGRHYDIGYKYTTYDFFVIPIFIEDEGKVVGYIDNSDYELLTSEGIDAILKENNIETIESIIKIPIWDKWGGKVFLFALVSIIVLFALHRKRKKYNEENELEL